MAANTDPIRQIFLAGIGALAMGAEKSQELIGQLVEKGKITVDEGKEQRDEFAAKVAEMAANIDMDDAMEAQEAQEVEIAAEQQD